MAQTKIDLCLLYLSLVSQNMLAFVSLSITSPNISIGCVSLGCENLKTYVPCFPRPSGPSQNLTPFDPPLDSSDALPFSESLPAIADYLVPVFGALATVVTNLLASSKPTSQIANTIQLPHSCRTLALGLVPSAFTLPLAVYSVSSRSPKFYLYWHALRGRRSRCCPALLPGFP